MGNIEMNRGKLDLNSNPDLQLSVRYAVHYTTTGQPILCVHTECFTSLVVVECLGVINTPEEYRGVMNILYIHRKFPCCGGAMDKISNWQLEDPGAVNTPYFLKFNNHIQQKVTLGSCSSST